MLANELMRGKGRKCPLCGARIDWLICIVDLGEKGRFILPLDVATVRKKKALKRFREVLKECTSLELRCPGCGALLFRNLDHAIAFLRKGIIPDDAVPYLVLEKMAGDLGEEHGR